MTEQESRGIEQRAHHRLLTYWHQLRGQASLLPEERQVDPEAIDDIWSSCFLVEINGTHYADERRFSYLGDALITAVNDDTVTIPRELLAINSMPMVEIVEEACLLRAPAIREVEFTDERKLRVKCRASVVPLGGRSLSHLLGCMRWKIC